MKRILSSASKLVLLMFAGSACVGLFVGVIDSAQFMVALGAVFGFYFGTSMPSGPASSQ